MANYDASIRVSTKADNSDLLKVQKAFDDIEKSLTRTKKSIEGDFDSLSDVVEDYATRLKELRNKGFGVGDKKYDDLYIAWKNAVNAEKEYLANLDKMTDKGIADEAARTAREQEKQAAAQRKIEEAQRKTEEAAERNLQKETARLEKEAQIEAKLQAEAAEQQRLKNLKDSASVSDERMVQLLQRQVELKNYLNDLEKAGVTAGYSQYDNATNELQQINSEISARKKLTQAIQESRKGLQRVSESSKKCFKTIQDGTKKSNGLLVTLGSRLKGIALSLLVFNWITKGFNAMVAAMKEGFQNLAKYSDDYNASMSALKSQTAQLKNGLAAAFEPVANIIIPYLTRLVSWLNTASDAVAQFFAAMQGKSTYTRAKKQVVDYAKSLDTASKSAKRALASFDELNVLNKNDDGSKTSGGLSGADAFEEAEINPGIYDALKKVEELLKIIKPIAVAVGVAFLAWKISSFLSDLGKVAGSLGNVFGIISLIAGLVIAVSSYFTMWKDGVDWEGISGYISGIALAVTGLYILFGPFAAGIGLIVAGIAGFVLALKDVMENGLTAENATLALISAVGILAGVFIAFGGPAALVVAGIMAAVAAIAALVAWAGNGEEAMSTLKDFCKNFADFFKKIFAGDVEGALESLKEAGKDFANLFIIVFESLINCIIKGLNWLIEKINSISFDVPDWVPFIGGDTLSPNLSPINEVNLPRLADGAVIQGGKPFAAILGDQRVGQTNIETPLKTMIEAFKQAMDDREGTAGGNYTFVAQLDGKTIFKETVKQDRIYQKSTGKSAFQY